MGMKILFVHPAAEISISDVSRGYRSALERAGHDIRDYHLGRRMDYHRKALPEAAANDQALLARQASETILNEALYHQSDVVLIISGLNVHPIAIWLLAQAGIPAAIILTESPYDDEAQAQWVDLSHVGAKADITIFTNDRYSAGRFGWHLLAPSFDPSIHFPAEPSPDEACGVLIVGTGWRERQAFLEAVNWNGIDLRIYGVWPGLNDNPDSPIHRFYRPMVIDNARIAPIYRAAKICLNFHRRSADALTPGPRAYELAACGAFQLSDPREDMTNIFGGSVPTFTSPERLEEMIRYYLVHDEERRALAAASCDRVQGHTFDKRVDDLVSTLSPLVTG